MRTTLLRSAILMSSVAAAGCGLSEQAQPLIPSQFVRSRAAVGPNPIGQPVGESGALAFGELHSPLLPDEYPNTHPKPAPGVSPQVEHDVPGPGEGVNPRAQLGERQTPATQSQAGQATGYQVVGTVVATVNTTPIFADKVIAAIDHELAAEARKYGPQEFRGAATEDILKEVRQRIEGQLEIEQANASLAQDAKTEAHLIAQLWRRQQITAAGGSEAIARQRALESGQSLDDQVQFQYNTALVRLYYQQHIQPLIHVSVADMKRYYDEHLQSDYSTQSELHFRLIRIDVAQSGSPEEASARADRVIDDLKAGANFEDEAKKINDDPSLKQTGGDIGWMQKGGYKYDAVEDAVSALKPGQFTDHPIKVSDPITGSAFYIAQLVDKRGGTRKSFDNIDVQNAINNKLFSAQFYQLREKNMRETRDKAAVVMEPNGIETAVDMAMQRYPVWAAAR